MRLPTASARQTPAHQSPVHQSYDKFTIGLHWATAGLVTILWLMGRTTGFLPRGPLRIDIWSVHILLGFSLAGVILTRIFWRLTYGRRLPPADRGMLQGLATAVHWLLYALLLAIATLGVINVFAHAFPLFNLWHFPAIGSSPDFAREINGWHSLAANIIAAVALCHAAAALFHHYVIRDGVLGRMWPPALTGIERPKGAMAASEHRIAE